THHTIQPIHRPRQLTEIGERRIRVRDFTIARESQITEINTLIDRPAHYAFGVLILPLASTPPDSKETFARVDRLIKSDCSCLISQIESSPSARARRESRRISARPNRSRDSKSSQLVITPSVVALRIST